MNKLNRGAQTDLRHIIYDIIGNFIALELSYIWFYVMNNDSSDSAGTVLVVSLIYIVIYSLTCNSFHLYDVSTFYYYDRVFRVVVIGCLMASTTILSLFYFIGHTTIRSEFYVTYFVLSFFLHIASACLSFIKNRKSSEAMQTLFVGRRGEFTKFTNYIKKTNTPIGEVGYILLDEKSESESDDDTKYLGIVTNGDLERVLQAHVVDQVYIMRSNGKSDLVSQALDICLEYGITSRLIFRVGRNNAPYYVSSVGTYPVVSYHMCTLNIIEQALKRLMDIAGALVGISISIPIVAIASIMIKLNSPGPVFFFQERVGRNGRHFKICKLRTMTTDAEARKKDLLADNEMDDGHMFKMKHDPRVTKVGAFLRRTSIDELPQFVNVLLGTMSLVGTRPPTLDEVEQYERSHWRRLRTKPGITGAWQVSGRSEISSFGEVVALDTEYIRNWSLWSDIVIILKTIAVIFNRKGAY